MITIGKVKAKPGEKVTGTLKVGETPISDISIPIGIVNGKKKGPTVCVIAGEHAMEYAGIDAAIRVFNDTDPDDLAGALIVVPVVNTPAFEARTPYLCPIDNVNVARAGKIGGTIGHVIARTLVEKVVSHADYLLNLHGGDHPELLYPFTICEFSGDESIDAETKKLGQIFGTKYITQHDYKTRISDRPAIGVPHIIGEAGSLGMFDESDIEVHTTGVTNVMKYLKMIEGEPKIEPDQKIIRDTIRIGAKRGGLFYPYFKAGEKVKKGDLIAEIRNVWGETKEKIIAPEDAIITYMFWRHVVNTGDPLIIMGKPESI